MSKRNSALVLLGLRAPEPPQRSISLSFKNWQTYAVLAFAVAIVILLNLFWR